MDTVIKAAVAVFIAAVVLSFLAALGLNLVAEFGDLVEWFADGWRWVGRKLADFLRDFGNG